MGEVKLKDGTSIITDEVSDRGDDVVLHDKRDFAIRRYTGHGDVRIIPKAKIAKIDAPVVKSPKK
jgi:hypothetical protein